MKNRDTPALPPNASAKSQVQRLWHVGRVIHSRKEAEFAGGICGAPRLQDLHKRDFDGSRLVRIVKQVLFPL